MAEVTNMAGYRPGYKPDGYTQTVYFHQQEGETLFLAVAVVKGTEDRFTIPEGWTNVTDPENPRAALEPTSNASLLVFRWDGEGLLESQDVVLLEEFYGSLVTFNVALAEGEVVTQWLTGGATQVVEGEEVPILGETDKVGTLFALMMYERYTIGIS